MEGNKRLVEWNYNKYQDELIKMKNIRNRILNNSNDEGEVEDIEIDEDNEEEEDDDDDETNHHSSENFITIKNNDEKGVKEEEENTITIDVQSSILVNESLITSTTQNQLSSNISFDMFTRKTDKVSIKGNLLKYSTYGRR